MQNQTIPAGGYPRHSLELHHPRLELQVQAQEMDDVLKMPQEHLRSYLVGEPLYMKSDQK